MTATAIIAVTAVLHIVLNVILIPSYGPTGASISLVIATATVFLISCVLSSRTEYGIPIRSLCDIIIKVALASAVMFFLVDYLSNLYILALVPSSALLYFGVLLIIRGIDKEDVHLLRSVFARQETTTNEKN